MAKRRKGFLGIGKHLGKNEDKVVWLVTLGAIGIGIYFMVANKKSGIAPLDTSLDSIKYNTEHLGGKIPVIGGFFPAGAGPSGGASTTGGGGAPKMTPTAAASTDGSDRFTNFSQAYWARSYAGRRTNDITDRLTVS